jgi:hypothetical protein
MARGTDRGRLNGFQIGESLDVLVEALPDLV